MKLNAKSVAALRRKPGRHGDGNGLYLQVTDAMVASWLLRYEHRGRERWMGLGPLHAFTLAEARERARLQRQLLADGIDPIEHRLAARDAEAKTARERLTFKEATEKFLAVHEATWKNAKHRQQWHNTLIKIAYPTLGARPVSALDSALINEAVAPVWPKTPETARRVRGRIERIVQWIKDGSPLPCDTKTRRNHPAMPWAELPAFIGELRERVSVSASALEFTILTAARTGETIGAVWSEIDLDGKMWTIPAERMKSGREHRVPLSNRAIAILHALPRERGNPKVFIGACNGNGLSNMAMLELLRGMRSNLSVHGFRSTFKDWCSEATHTPNMVSEAALAHVVGDRTEAAYRRGDLFAKRAKLMARWAAYCESTPAPVVAMRKVAA